MRQPPEIIAGRYRVLRELGRGGMGAVYLVEHLHTGDELALKMLHAHVDTDPAIVERFKREARAPARIKSEHVVKVVDADVAPELGGVPFLVMECLNGEDFEKIIRRRGPLPPAEVVSTLRQAAIALDKAHAMGIVHRDLKPENLFLHQPENGEPIVKVVDFGVSKMGTNESLGVMGEAGLTRTGAMLGTPLYMSPEQAIGAAKAVTPATDIWAIGLITYRMLTGSVYWRSKTIVELMMELVQSELTPPSIRSTEPGTNARAAVPVAFDAWFARSCDRRPEARFASVGEQVITLAQALGVPECTQQAAGTGYAPLAADAVPSIPALRGSLVSHGTIAGGLAHSTATSMGNPRRMPAIILAVTSSLALLMGGTLWLRRANSISSAVQASAAISSPVPMQAMETPSANVVSSPPLPMPPSAPATSASASSSAKTPSLPANHGAIRVPGAATPKNSATPPKPLMPEAP